MSAEKFRLLCWKNFTLQKRHPIAGFFELLFPILIVVLFAFARNNLEQQTSKELRFRAFQPRTYQECITYTGQPYETIGVSPDNNQALVELVRSSVGASSGIKIEFFESAKALNNFLNTENSTVAGIEFDDHLKNSATLPKTLRYSIRLPHDPAHDTWQTKQLYFVSISKTAREGSNNYPWTPPYNDYCFLAIQNDIERAFIKAQAPNSTVPKTILQKFPYPSITEDTFVGLASILFPVLLMFCMLMSMKNTIKNVTVERESQLKETMKMMGLSSSLHWSAWFTKCIVMKEISIVIMVIIMSTTIVSKVPIFAYSNPFLVWFFLSIYASGVITFCFLISVIFKKSSTAANVGSIVFFMTIVPFTRWQNQFYTLNYFVKILYCLCVNAGMGQGMQLLLLSESNEVGMHFNTLFTREVDLQFSFGELIIVMMIGIVIQMLVTCYIEKVFPGDIGIPEPWYFPFLPVVKFLRKKMGYNSLVNHDAILQERRISGADYEDEPNLKAGVRISNLSKVFESKAAVKNLNLNIFEDQITVLLGHNGAGKTTTMSMLTGMYPPTSGTAYLNGKDIRSEIDDARKSLGLCPQHNILFDELTVKEHFIFFARLKGIKGNREIADEVRRYVNLLELKDKANAQSHTLSGGMKRKLSIGIALCGDSKIVICDEPSSGMDPAGRRALWDLLISEKKGRTILISTHHMDEADVLGDRIAIMSEGQLRTAGSSFFLKKKFGTGYKLICEKHCEAHCDINVILDLLREYVPDTHVESDTQTEVIFVLSENYLPIFHVIFKRLEDESARLKITSFGCNLTTLEEVFLKLGTESAAAAQDEEHHETAINGAATVVLNDLMSVRTVTGTKLMCYQIQAMCLKKFHYMRRNFKSILYMILLSAVMIVLMMSAPSISLNAGPSLVMDLDSYDDTTTVIEADGTMDSLVSSYKSLLAGKDQFVSTTTDMQTVILKEYNDSLPTVNRKYLVAATIKSSGITAWFNGQPYHTLPLTLNMINRAILKNAAGREYDLEVTNKPYEFTRNEDGSRVQVGLNEIVVPLILLFILMTQWPSVFIGFYIKERESRAKLLQLISGANRFIYWFTSFAFDFALYLVVIFVIVGGIGAYQRMYMSTMEELGTILVILIFYGIATLPFVYAFSYLFAKHSTGESMIAVAGVFTVVIYGVYALFKYLLQNAIWKFLAKVIYWLGLMIGPFSLIDSFITYGMAALVPGTNIFSFSESGIGWNLLMMAVGGVFFMTICLMKDHLLFDKFIYKYLTMKRTLPLIGHGMDADVLHETERIRNMSDTEIANGNLVLKGLTKYYGNHLAVNQLHLAVGGAECFGLLGINGAGKTTTFKMMTGDEIISSGDAFIRGYSMRNEMHKVHQLIGYCPQFDALLMDLTGRETMRIFALLRGIPKPIIDELTNKFALELGFNQHLDKKIDAYSGGNKRKLSTALSLIGDPSLIFLDEPTTGMDPGAKRQLWNIINKTRNSGRSVVLTSHSMEECEALCTKLAIMVNGEFKCLGSTQHLKNKFSKGFILTVKAGREDEEVLEDIKTRVNRMFPSAELKERYMDISTFHITDDFKWSEVFLAMANMKNEIGLADYALTQTSLEQVFLFFTKSGLYQSKKTE